MQITFRWFGKEDPVRLEFIRQIPGVTGIVSALHDADPGLPWPADRIARLKDRIEGAGMDFSVVESIPVHESIKLGSAEADRHLDTFCTTLERVASVGIGVVCYNFMPVVDWVRTDMAYPLPDGSTTLAFDDTALEADGMRATPGTLPENLPGWMPAGNGATLLKAWQGVENEALWDSLAAFLERVVPVAAATGVKLAVHPDDPPWSVFGIPRILTSTGALERLTELVDHPANGVTLCTGSLGARSDVDLVDAVERLAGRIHFLHARSVSVAAPGRFHETAHPDGDVDLAAVLHALRRTGFDGPVRPDHGRMIWDEKGRPGYGLHDRALGAAYLRGIIDGLNTVD